jgi:hypothetical protein
MTRNLSTLYMCALAFKLVWYSENGRLLTPVEFFSRCLSFFISYLLLLLCCLIATPSTFALMFYCDQYLILLPLFFCPTDVSFFLLAYQAVPSFHFVVYC